MYPYFVTAGEYNTIQLVSNYVIVILLASVIILFIIDMLHSERIKVLKKTIEIKDVRIAKLEIYLGSRYRTVREQQEEIALLGTKLEKYQKAFSGLSGGVADCMKVTDVVLRKFALNQSPQAEKLEEKIWNQEIGQEQKIETSNKV